MARLPSRMAPLCQPVPLAAKMPANLPNAASWVWPESMSFARGGEAEATSPAYLGERRPLQPSWQSGIHTKRMGWMMDMESVAPM